MHLGGNKVETDVDDGDVTDYSSYHLLNCGYIFRYISFNFHNPEKHHLKMKV